MQNVYILGPEIKNSEPIGLWQIHPFALFKKQFQKAGYTIIRKHARTAEEINHAADNLQNPNIIVIRPDWTEKPKDILNLCKTLKEHYDQAKLIMLDPFDQTSSRFFESLPYLNAFVKYQALKDKSLYLNDYVGGVYALQKLKDEFGVAPADDWSVRSKVESGQQQKIVSGNFVVEPGLIKRILSPLNTWLLSFTKKDIDLFCHMSCGKRGELEWYGKHRLIAIEQMQSLTDYNISVKPVFSGEPGLSAKEYAKSQKASRIVYSSLGWGEVTMRAYEAIASGNLLIQPDVSHLDIFPNIFVPNETYIPVKWDLSDLAEKCEYYINHEDERLQVVDNARQAFINEFTADSFIKRMETIFAM